MPSWCQRSLLLWWNLLPSLVLPIERRKSRISICNGVFTWIIERFIAKDLWVFTSESKMHPLEDIWQLPFFLPNRSFWRECRLPTNERFLWKCWWIVTCLEADKYLFISCYTLLHYYFWLIEDGCNGIYNTIGNNVRCTVQQLYWNATNGLLFSKCDRLLLAHRIQTFFTKMLHIF